MQIRRILLLSVVGGTEARGWQLCCCEAVRDVSSSSILNPHGLVGTVIMRSRKKEREGGSTAAAERKAGKAGALLLASQWTDNGQLHYLLLGWQCAAQPIITREERGRTSVGIGRGRATPRKRWHHHSCMIHSFMGGDWSGGQLTGRSPPSCGSPAGAAAAAAAMGFPSTPNLKLKLQPQPQLEPRIGTSRRPVRLRCALDSEPVVCILTLIIQS